MSKRGGTLLFLLPTSRLRSIVVYNFPQSYFFSHPPSTPCLAKHAHPRKPLVSLSLRLSVAHRPASLPTRRSLLRSHLPSQLARSKCSHCLGPESPAGFRPPFLIPYSGYPYIHLRSTYVLFEPIHPAFEIHGSPAEQTRMNAGTTPVIPYCHITCRMAGRRLGL